MNINGVLTTIVGIMDTLVPVLAGLATIFFIWGVVTYIMAAGDEGKRSEGKDRIIYGLIGLFVLVSMWGLVSVLTETFQLDTGAPTMPTIPR